LTVPEARTVWAEKANRLYDATYARRYRAHDDHFDRSEPCVQLSDWLKRVCGRFGQPIAVLDLGCGTGRYFWALTGVSELVGLDASAAMLAEARRPYNADRVTAGSITLVEGDLFGHDFGPARFDLIYSIGVLAEHVPLDERIVARVARWLRPRGRFAFTTVHPDSPSIPATAGRRLGRRLLPVAPRRIRTLIRARMLSEGLYADEARVRELLAPVFAIEALERFQSEAHLHCLCVATKRAA
jgi:SAM-dependent methyltransferase